MELAYRARPGQDELRQAVLSVQGSQQHGIFEAATGTGKTAAVLTASIGTARAQAQRIVYLTRTNAQQDQVVAEHAALVASGQDPGLLVPMMGRQHYCPLMKDDDRFQGGSSEELGRLCRDAKRKAVLAAETGGSVKGACPYYEGLLHHGTDPVEALLRTSCLPPERLAERISGCGSCPYEALKALLPKADVVSAPFVFMIDGALRHTFLQWMGADAMDVHVVVDEAHNLPSAAQEHHSPRLSMHSLRRAAREAEEFHDPALAGSVLTTSLLHAVQAVILDLADEHLGDNDDARVPPGAVEEMLMERLAVPSTRLLAAARDLEAWGDVVREDRRAKGRLPRSYLGAVGAFLRAWWDVRDEPYVQLVTGPEEPAIEAYLLEPARVLGWLRDMASTVHISGTLAPCDEHRALCGLPEETAIRVFEDPYGSERLRIVGVHGLHRRWADQQQDPAPVVAQQDATARILASAPDHVAVFFPSRAMLEDWRECGALDVGRRLFVETDAADSPELSRLVERFKRHDGPALLAGVLGGRIAEGLDFPGDQLEAVIVLGVPYPPPSTRVQALVDHLDRLHDGKGWTYAVHGPTGRRIRQAIGRLVRGPEDKGTAYILDERIVRFRPMLRGLTMAEDVEQAIRAASEPPSGGAESFRPAAVLQEGTVRSNK